VTVDDLALDCMTDLQRVTADGGGGSPRRDQHGQQKVRRIFSASPIARQLGVVIQTTGIAPTFAEVEAMLAKTKQDCGDPFRALLRGPTQTSSRGAHFRFVPWTFVLDR
jgi:hypothetical protein